MWRFRNAGNRAAFAAHPDVYMPQFGGYDPVVLARGVTMPGHPGLWLIVGDRLYLFHTQEARDAFAADPAVATDMAQANWRALRPTLVPYALHRPYCARRVRITPRQERRHKEAALHLTVRERLAGRVRDNPTCCGENCVPRRDVPLTRRCQPRIDIGPSFGDQAELERGAERLPRGHRHAAEELLGGRIEMRAADRATNPPAGALRVRIGVGSRGILFRMQDDAARPLADDAAPDQALGRGSDQTGDGVRSLTSAMLTVYSGRPATNSRVPSKGSTSRKVDGRALGPPRAAAASSETTATPGSRRARWSRMTASEASSAAVTGE